MMIDQGAKQFPGDERGVAGEDQERARQDLLGRREDRVPGAQLLLLQRDQAARRKMGLDLSMAVP